MLAALRWPRKTSEELAEGIGDNIRYTTLFEVERYVTGVQDSVRAMKLQGYELVKVANGWKGEKGNYKGLNLTWRDPETGHLFELQFHTPDSFWINKSEHFYYEIQRLPDLEPGTAGEWDLTKTEAAELSKEMWSHAKLPGGAKELDLPLGR